MKRRKKTRPQARGPGAERRETATRQTPEPQTPEPQTPETATPPEREQAPSAPCEPSAAPPSLEPVFDRWGFWILLALLFLMCAVVFFDFLTFQKVYMFRDVGGDSVNVYYPELMWLSRYLRSDGIPSWCFNVGLGQDLSPGGIFDPFRWLLFALGPQHLAYGIAFTECAKVIAAGVLFFFYLRTLSLPASVALIGGLCYGFCGYMMVGTGWYKHSALLASFAVLLLGFEQCFLKSRYTIFPLGVMLVAGPSMFFCGIFVALYSIARAVDTYGWRLRPLLVLWGKLAGLVVLGILLAAPAMVGTTRRILESPRGSGTVSHVNRLAESPLFGFEDSERYGTAVLRLFSNDLLHTGSDFRGWENYLEAPAFYCGVLLLLLVPQMLILCRRPRQRLAWGGFLTAWILVVVFPHLRYACYLYMGDYYKNGISLFVPVTILFCALHAFAALRSEQRLGVKTLLATVAVLLWALYSPPHYEEDAIHGGVRGVVTAFLVSYAALLYVVAKTRYRDAAYVAILALVVVELTISGCMTVFPRDTITREEFESKSGYNDYTVDAVKFIKERDPGFYRIEKNYTSMPGSRNDAQVQDYYGSSCYASFNQPYYIGFLQGVGIVPRLRPEHAADAKIVSAVESWTRWTPGVSGENHASNKKSYLLQALVSVKYRLIKATARTPLDAYTRNEYEKIATFGNVDVYEAKVFIPVGVVYDRWLRRSAFESVRLKPEARGRVLYSAVVLEGDSAPAGLVEIDPEESVSPRQAAKMLARRGLQVKRHTQRSLHGTVETDRGGMLVFSIPFDPGWQVFVDGEPTATVIAQVGFFGVPLAAGTHRVDLEYQSPYCRQGVLLQVIGVLIYLGLLLRQRFSAAGHP